MKPGLLSFLEKVSGQVHPKHQEFLDEHFSISPQWKEFKKKLRSPTFVEAVKDDTRSDEKLKRYSEANATHVQAKGVPSFPVPSQSSSKWYTVKYHPDINRFTCNCGDWVHKRSWKEEKKQRDCKHVQLVRMELKNQGVDVKSLTKQAAEGRAAARLLELLR
jgi:hypothetical protein